MTIGESIRKIRKEEGLTQRELAEKTNLNEVTIRSYEANKYKPKIENLQKIADALNASLLDFGVVSEDFTKLRMELERQQIVQFSSSEAGNSHEMLSNFSALNKKGQQKALDYLKDLLQIDEYTIPDEE